MSKLLIKNAAIVTMDDEKRIIQSGDILIEGSAIHYVGESGQIPAYGDARIIDGAEKVALPGLINAHTHAAMTLFRGYADDMALKEWLETKIWPREAHLKAEDVYWGTMLAIVEMIKGGATCFADMYFYTDEVARAVQESGIRASICGVLLDFLPTANDDLKKAIAFVEKWHGEQGRVTAMFGPHALYTCKTDYLKKMAIEARRLGVGIHIHVLETHDERDEIRKLNDAEPFDILQVSGILDQHVLAAHAAYLTSGEIKLIRDYPFVPVHCPGSNLKLASGVAPVWEYLQEKIDTGLGTDGAASNNNLDMFEEIRLAALIHKEEKFDPTVVSAYQALELATRGSAHALGLEREIGQIKEGMRADIILVDFKQPHLTPRHNIEANLVYSASAADVTETIVNGQLLMENRKLLTVNEEEVMKKASEAAMDLVNRS